MLEKTAGVGEGWEEHCKDGGVNAGVEHICDRGRLV